VRITSPPPSPPNPSSPSEGSSAPRSYHDTPSTPFSRTFPTELIDEDEDDPFDKSSSSGDEESPESVDQMPEPVVTSKRMSVAPANPFSRTLATMEEPLRASGLQEHGLDKAGPQPAATEKRGMPRASMDVNAFKNLLMTGKATPMVQPAPPLPKPQGITLADNSSSTDTSSISRQSLFEHVQEMASESPRTSYELSISEDDDKPSHLDRRKSTKVKPPPPRHRHGKAVTPKGPQIVSFSDFEPIVSASNDQKLPITISIPPSSPIRAPLERKSSELNRPLPAPPARRASSRESVNIEKELSSPRRSLDFPSTDSLDSTSSKRVPPAPPLARRSSTLNPLGPRSRSNTQASITSQSDETLRSYADSIAESTTSSVKIPPPPPPARRSGAVHGHSNNPSPSATEEGSSLIRSLSLKSPPPPPSRNRSMSARSSPAINTPGMMSPPPRPAPRRTSSKSSFEQVQTSPPGSRRASGEQTRSSIDLERRPSISSIVREKSISEETGRDLDGARDPASQEALQASQSNPDSKSANDVLAEMEAFQREIDALREKFGQTS
jgi:hypothetical protein